MGNLTARSTFYFKVAENAMSGDRIQKADTVLIASVGEPSFGDILLLEVESKEAPILRRLERDGNNCILIPSNESVKVERHAAEEVCVIGKVIASHIQY